MDLPKSEEIIGLLQDVRDNSLRGKIVINYMIFTRNGDLKTRESGFGDETSGS